ncbi:peroxiredoxin family protein [Pedobacter sp. AW1-32]|uniref:peroxiredoxin family protein n=1 Tax=Pedobacter sp. AW1-32 TaxID=3383026 RepID=UPI003FEFAFD0
MKSNLLFICLLALILTSCKPKPAQFNIKASNIDNNAVLSVFDAVTGKLYKAENIHNGAQLFHINLPKKGYASMEIDVLNRKRKYWFYLDEGDYEMKIDGKKTDYPITSASSDLQNELINFYTTSGRRKQMIADSLEVATQLLDTANPLNVDARARNMEKWQTKLVDAGVEAVEKFAIKYPKSELSILLMEEIGDIAQNPQRFSKIFNALDANVRESKLGEKFNIQLQRANKMAVGSIMPAIEGKDLQGKKFDKKILKKTNLIICWAAYSGQSRRDNLAFVKLYERFKNENVEFISVSFDNYESSWKSGIAKSKMSWPQYSDLLGSKSPNAKNLSNFNASYYFIIDQSGKVLANNISMDLVAHELEKAIKKTS